MWDLAGTPSGLHTIQVSSSDILYNGTNAPTFWYITTCQNQTTPRCARCPATVLLSSARTIEDPGPRFPMCPRMRSTVIYAVWLATLAMSSTSDKRTLVDTALSHRRNHEDTLDNCVSATPLGGGRISLLNYPCWTRRLPYPCWTHSPHSSCPLLAIPPTTSGTTVHCGLASKDSASEATDRGVRDACYS